MLEALRRREFKLKHKSYKFDSSGDINMGYDIVMWTSEASETSSAYHVVAEYHPLYSSIAFVDQQNPSTKRLLRDLKVGPHAVALVFTWNLL